MKIKRRKPKAKRTSFAKRIATAKTHDEKRRLALTGRLQPPDGAALIVKHWQAARYLRSGDKPPHKGDVRAYTMINGKVEKRFSSHDLCLQSFDIAERETQNFIRRAMLAWRPEMLRELAREMERAEKAGPWTPDGVAYYLLRASRTGPVNLAELKRAGDKNKDASADLRTWRRRAHQLSIPVRAAGRPKTMRTV